MIENMICKYFARYYHVLQKKQIFGVVKNIGLLGIKMRIYHANKVCIQPSIYCFWHIGIVCQLKKTNCKHFNLQFDFQYQLSVFPQIQKPFGFQLCPF